MSKHEAQEKSTDRRSSQSAGEASLPAIAIQNLSKTFGNLYALRKVSLDLNQGDFLTIFGPNGAGKTTLIRILSTITSLTAGDVTIAGFALSKQPEPIRNRIGVIAHQTFLYEELTAQENLRFYGKLYQVQNLDSRIESMLNDVGLQARKHDPVRTFSRGMQQRLSIARAMLHDPEILLLDEPYTGLDQHAAEMLTGWLKRLRSSHRTTLMVTHDLERGIDLADRIAILHDGRLVFEEVRSAIDPATFRQTYYDFVENSGRQR